MRPKRYPKLDKSKDFEPSSYRHYDKIDISSKHPTFNKVVVSNNLNFFELPSLQIETEKILSQLGHRIKSLSGVLNGKNIDQHNGNAAMSESSLCANGESTHSTETRRSSRKELIVKSVPEKPLTLIIAQNLRSGGRRIGTKRSIAEAEASLNYSALELTCSTSTGVTSTPKRKRGDQHSSAMPPLAESPILKLSIPIPSESNTNNIGSSTGNSRPYSTEIGSTVAPNYEIPNKFWELMEPYCAEINDEHLNTLEHMIRAYELDAHFYELPSPETPVALDTDNGEHDRAPINRRYMPPPDDDSMKKHLNGFVDTNRNGIDLSSLLKKIDTEIRKPLSHTKSLGSFPARLASKISQQTDLEITPHVERLRSSKASSITSESAQSSKSIAKQLKVNNGFKLEKHVKKSMEDLGLCYVDLPFVCKLEPAANPNTKSEEEGIARSGEADIIDPIVLTDGDYVEVRVPEPGQRVRNTKMEVQVRGDRGVRAALGRRQAELRLISESNLGMLRRLLLAARRDVRRQAVERRLAVADADVIEAYNVIESYRPSHRQPLKKDRDAAFKALKERQKILKELELLDSEFF